MEECKQRSNLGRVTTYKTITCSQVRCIVQPCTIKQSPVAKPREVVQQYTIKGSYQAKPREVVGLRGRSVV